MTTDPFMVQYIIENCTLVDYVTLANNAKVSVQTAVNIIKKAGLWDKCARVPRSTLSTKKSTQKIHPKKVLADNPSKKSTQKTEDVEVLPPETDFRMSYIPKDPIFFSRDMVVQTMAEQVISELAMYKDAVARVKAGDRAAVIEAMGHQKLVQSALVSLGRWSGLDKNAVEQTVKDKLTDEALRNMNLTELLNQGE